VNFEYPAYNRYDYNLGYQVTDNVEVSFVVNNLFNNFLEEAAFVGSASGRGDAIGRRFTLAVNARF
jgi:outer membrane receptor protein involved in Fe transport